MCIRISINNDILAKLRHFLTLSQMKQLYYSIIFPSFHTPAKHGKCVYKTHINKVQTKQNHFIRLIFFARTFGDQTASALPLLNLLDVLTVNNVYRLPALKFTHSWHKAYYQACFMISFNTPVKCMDTTPDMHLDKISTYQKCISIVVNKQLQIQRLFSGTIFLLILKILISSTS